jgi:serine/threonine protein kinase
VPVDAVRRQSPSCLLRLALSAPDDVAFDFNERCFGDYDLGRQIGAGGMGVVYEARRLTDSTRVALKLIRNLHAVSPQALCRFTIEAEAAARLHHPHIVRIHEIGEINGQPFISMDYVEGESLTTKIGVGSTALSTKDMAQLLAKIARAVHHAHLRGVLHRDVKPANILIDSQGEPRLTDFGLAKLLDEADPSSLTGTGDALGTPGYMSPEQVQGKEIGCGADVYGLGAVLYALLTGCAPFRGNTPLETFKLIVEEPPVSPRRICSSIDQRLETICLKCLEKDPRRRYSTAEALADDLDAVAAGRSIRARRASALYRTRQWIERNPAGSALIATLFVGLAIAVSLLKVVDQQRRQIQLDRDLAFDDGMEKISQLWRDPNTRAVTISARELNILAGRPLESRGARYLLTFGITANDSPSSMAQRYARFLGGLQAEMERELGEKVAFSLKLSKGLDDGDESVNGDVSVLSAVSFLRAQQQSNSVTAIAIASPFREVVLFGSTAAGARNVAELRAKRILLPPNNSTLATWTKSTLLQAGLRAADAQICSVDQMLDPVEVIARVLRGQSDASVIQRQQFERYKHRGLVELARFRETPNMLAARAGLAPKISTALANALRTPRANDSGLEVKFLADPVAIESALDPLRRAMEAAMRFEDQAPLQIPKEKR